MRANSATRFLVFLLRCGIFLDDQGYLFQQLIRLDDFGGHIAREYAINDQGLDVPKVLGLANLGCSVSRANGWGSINRVYNPRNGGINYNGILNDAGFFHIKNLIYFAYGQAYARSTVYCLLTPHFQHMKQLMYSCPIYQVIMKLSGVVVPLTA